MAVQAQYPSNILLFNRNVQDSKNNNIILEQQQPCVGDFLEQSHMFFNHNGVGVNNPRKRSREIATTATHTTTTTTVDSFSFSLQNQNRHQNHQLIDLSQQQQQQQQQHPSFVSTGLKLSFGEQNQQQQQQKQQIQQQQQQQPALLTLFSDELAFQFKQQNDELNYFLRAQGEQLRRALSEKRQRHYTALLRSAEAAVARQVREKEVQLDTVARRNAELEARAAQLNSEAQVWQARAQAQEAQAVSLQTQIQQAMNGPGPNNAVGPLQPERDTDAEDAESVYDDPAAVEGRARSPCCKACRKRDASVVLLPCRHLCVCVQCDNIVQACPLCFSLRTASVEVYLT